MHSIYIAAIITTLSSIVVWGGLYYYFLELNLKLDRYLFLLPLGAMSCPIVNLFVKMPLLKVLKDLFNIQGAIDLGTPLSFLLIFLFIPPVTEEIVKIVPALFMKIREMDNKTLFRVAYMLGFGFGLGEIWYIAYNVAKDPGMQSTPFYYFGGFMGERFIVSFIHAGLTVVALTGFGKSIKRPGVMGLMIAILLHAAGNVSAIIYRLRVLPEIVGQQINSLSIGILLCILVVVVTGKMRSIIKYQN
ncbi:PrsW family glutamic-type intramembrane protease [Kosmotoga olearia]|uniref:Protease PrsW n=1 Tax=Kosmotoga olearia (strain ATCC BAA-1733 / DSM 21960 / TBF 19.5.1) TaxID=521045 RepID=C5CH42_KOSOT|nr:PrsW family glutamic-type intramembrane protease [Kosmotoga olearia]ACR80645.1 hypothetical protein Kole_1964 [Kosmotoga olearia TBF 19.5.1]